MLRKSSNLVFSEDLSKVWPIEKEANPVPQCNQPLSVCPYSPSTRLKSVSDVLIHMIVTSQAKNNQDNQATRVLFNSEVFRGKDQSFFSFVSKSNWTNKKACSMGAMQASIELHSVGKNTYIAIAPTVVSMPSTVVASIHFRVAL